MRDFARDDFDAFLILSGFLNSATYLSVGTDTLLDLLLVSSVVLLPSDSAVSTFCLGGEFILLGISLPLLVLCSFCSSAGVFISARSSSLLILSLLISGSGSLGSGVLTGSESGTRSAADVNSSTSVRASCAISFCSSSCA